jgi:hypothetical protein
MDELNKLIEKYGQPFADAALKATSIDLLTHKFCTGLLCAGSLFLISLFHKAYNDEEKKGEKADEDAQAIISFFLLASYVLAFISFCLFVEPWGWIGMFSPDLYIAHQAMDHF